MSHTKEKHEENMNSLCRLCGKKTLTYKEQLANSKPYQINTTLSRSIDFVCGLHVIIDESHSKYDCRKCYTTLQNLS